MAVFSALTLGVWLLVPAFRGQVSMRASLGVMLIAFCVAVAVGFTLSQL